MMSSVMKLKLTVVPSNQKGNDMLAAFVAFFEAVKYYSNDCNEYQRG